MAKNRSQAGFFFRREETWQHRYYRSFCHALRAFFVDYPKK
jgi:hypothetical protein